MLTGDFTIPATPGLVLGGVVNQKDFELPILQQKVEAWRREVSAKEKEKNTLKDKMSQEANDYKSRWNTDLPDSKKKEFQQRLNLANLNYMSAKDDYARCFEELDRMVFKRAEANAKGALLGSNPNSRSVLAIKKRLPIDFKRTGQPTYYNIATPSEKMYEVTFTSKDQGNVRQKIDAFFTSLFESNSPSNCMSQATIDSVFRDVEVTVANLQSEVTASLVGSKITLPWVKGFDKVYLSSHPFEDDDDLKQSKDNYFVITQVVLGAVFVALGKHEQVRAKKESSAVLGSVLKEEAFSELHSVSFYSQGVIPKASSDRKDVNMLRAYTEWKQALEENDAKSGFPLEYRTTPLSQIIKDYEAENDH